MKNTDARLAKAKYLEISELGTRFNLSFSSQLVLGNKIIALDGKKKCLLVMETGKEANQPFIIDLNEMAAVTIKKSYGSIKQGGLGNKGVDEFLQSIELQFEFSGKPGAIVLPFYELGRDEKRDRPKLDRSAKNWQMILSKMVGNEAGKKIIERDRSTLGELPLVTASYA